ncbi:MAG: tol-pal system protein YbgF [Caulobacterales bacterium]
MKRSSFYTRMMAAPLAVMLLMTATSAFARSKDDDLPVIQPDPIVQRLQSRVETLESANRRLTGDIEALQQQNRNLQNENQAVRGISDELTARIVSLEQSMKVQAALGFGSDLPAAPPPTAASAAPKPPSMSAPGAPTGLSPSSATGADAAAPQQLSPQTQLLRDGQYKLSGGDIDGAVKSLQSVISQYPKTADATEARFWLGQAQYVQGDYPNAAQSFVNLLQSAPKNKRAPDAMIRLGSTLGKMGSKSDACSTLSQVLVQYPKASPETKARLKNEKLAAGCKA